MQLKMALVTTLEKWQKTNNHKWHDVAFVIALWITKPHGYQSIFHPLPWMMMFDVDFFFVTTFIIKNYNHILFKWTIMTTFAITKE
jgi:hypothetical protein